ncbi:hypothetical protein N7454_003009 [Penicillium verhagenii]|nr:hypothetical protein N7454_003009 [Penicillium verhagenii]
MPPAPISDTKAKGNAPESSKAKAKKFEHLDAAATAVARILKQEGISYMFVGGYAASVLGGDRLTEDLDVVVNKECCDFLVKQANFRRSTDNRLIFCHNGKDVLVDVAHHYEWYGKAKNDRAFPNPDKCILLYIDIPERRMEIPLPILHPRTLVLTKLAPWYDAHISTRSEGRRRAETDLEDIIVLLQWLTKRGQKVDFIRAPKPPGSKVQHFLLMLGALFLKVEKARPLLASVLPPHDMREALTKAMA